MKLRVNIFPINIELLGQNNGPSNVGGILCGSLSDSRAAGDQQAGDPRFKAGCPARLLEMSVDGILSFARSRVGHAAEFVAPVTMTLMAYVFFTTFVEIFGLPPATKTSTAPWRWVSAELDGEHHRRQFAAVKGSKTSAPLAGHITIKVMTDLITPVSMGIRLFSNVLVGGVVVS